MTVKQRLCVGIRTAAPDHQVFVHPGDKLKARNILRIALDKRHAADRAEAIDLIRQVRKHRKLGKRQLARISVHYVFAVFKLLGQRMEHLAFLSVGVFNAHYLLQAAEFGAYKRLLLFRNDRKQKLFLKRKQLLCIRALRRTFILPVNFAHAMLLSHCPLDLIHAFYDLLLPLVKLQLLIVHVIPIAAVAADKPRGIVVCRKLCYEYQ